MTPVTKKLLVCCSALLLLAAGLGARAEQVAKLPAPTGYVNDFAGVLSPDTKQQVESLCAEVDREAHAQIAVVTVKTIQADDGTDESIEEFATALEDKWKVGTKGTDRGVLMLFVMSPMKGRIEVGYGLEGVLNDAKVGDIGRTMAPAAKAGDYNAAIPLGVNEIAQDIAADANVTLAPIGNTYHYQRVHPQQVQLSLWQVLVGGGIILLILIFLISTGQAGWIFLIVMNLLGGGGGGGFGGGDDDRGGGGGFGGFGGGSSGGGGASGDW